MRSLGADGRLNSWKAIANHIKRSERTARRWEAEEGMPVHRHMHQSLASVYAYASEIDRWMARGESDRVLESAVTLPPRKPEQASIAVLPFDFIGADDAKAYIADGLTDEIIADLAKLESLRVISRTSSMQLKGKAQSIKQIAATLNVAYLLEGSLRVHEDAIRVSVQVLDPESDQQLWSEKYAAKVHEVFEIQERIAREVASALRLRLSATDEQRLARQKITDWSAWLAVVKARQESMQWTRAGIDRAVECLQDALKQNADIGYLYAALGQTYLHYREAGLDLSERPLQEAEKFARKTFQAEPESADGYRLLGWLHYSRGEIQLAVQNLKNALSRQWPDPDALSLLCNCYLISGQVAEARTLIPQAQAMDPLSMLVQALPAWADVLEGKHENAIDPYRALLEQEPENLLARLFVAWILTVNGRAKEVEQLATVFSDDESDSLPAQVTYGLAAAGRGQDPGLNLSAQDQQMASINDMYPRMLAQAYALAGNNEKALEWLSLAVSRGFINFPYLNQHDPLLTRLKGDQRYEDLLARVEQRWKDFAA